MTMTLVSTVQVGAGGATSIDFTSIPQTATDLLVVVSGRFAGTSIVWLSMNFNSDATNANYAIRALVGNGSTTASQSNAVPLTAANNSATETASTFSNAAIYIPNYTASVNKSFSSDSVTENNGASARQHLVAGIWNNTAAISAIKLKSYDGSTFVQDSTASLYTITKGSGGASVA